MITEGGSLVILNYKGRARLLAYFHGGKDKSSQNSLEAVLTGSFLSDKSGRPGTIPMSFPAKKSLAEETASHVMPIDIHMEL